MFDRLVIPRAIYEAMVEHGRQSLPLECCGFLIGRSTAGDGQVEELIPLTNRLASATRYEADAAELVRVQKRLREINPSGNGLVSSAIQRELAIYHTHPSSPPIPSLEDRERNGYGNSIVHLIIGLAAEVPDVRGWWLDGDQVREATWEIV